MKTKFIFITGGVVSSLGKGISAASIAALLKAHNFKVRVRKLDPYLNVDPGTMSPTQHGEVYVTNDGAETDLDLGHYERFTDSNSKKLDNVTAGKIYSKLLQKERKGEYLGGTVQVIPHVTDLIKEFIYSDLSDEDFVIYEVGGTVGDIEGLPFFEAIRQVGNERGRENAIFIHVTLVPYVKAAKELKTKPTQHSVKELRSIGIQPDILVCRSERKISLEERKKIALFCNLDENSVIEALDVKSIYQVPLYLRKQFIDRIILKKLAIEKYPKADLKIWEDLEEKISTLNKEVEIAIVGKYLGLQESYKSLIEALDHAGFLLGYKIRINWVDARKLGSDIEVLKSSKAILVPGGFGHDGIEGKINAIKYARENNIPYLGICFGMQLAVIEFARNVLQISDAASSEYSDSTNNIVGLMTEWQDKEELVKRDKKSNLGGTMRLGSYDCFIEKDSLAFAIYNKSKIQERHRHRYEVNINFKQKLEGKNMKISGVSENKKLPEIIELTNHPFFIAVQFHPEFSTRPFKAHPLFVRFVKEAIK
ncbi:MAG: CTP synthase [Rickettsiales bacterium]|nr:CTP synthase [Rickettsiales bacterium]